MPPLHDSPTHNTRSVSWVTDISSTESSDSAQPNGSTSDHPTWTPVRPVQSYLKDPRDCCNLRRGTLPEFSSPTPANRRLTKKHRQQPIQPHGIWQWSRKCTPSAQTRLFKELGRTTEESTCSSMQVGISTQRDVRLDHPKVQGQISCEGISTRIWR